MSWRYFGGRGGSRAGIWELSDSFYCLESLGNGKGQPSLNYLFFFYLLLSNEIIKRTALFKTTEQHCLEWHCYLNCPPFLCIECQ